MATAGEQLLIYSTLSGTFTTEEHFLSIALGGKRGDPVLVGRGCNYEIAYLGTEKKLIEYRAIKRFKTTYLNSLSFFTSLKPAKTINMTYNASLRTKIKIKCQL